MKHFYVKQSRDNVENSSSSVIEKIYNLVTRHELTDSEYDNSTDFRGEVNVNKTYESYVTKIKSKFVNFFINATEYYVTFKDKILEQILATSIGDGYGVTTQNIQSVTNDDVFKNIDFTGATSFHEFGRFTNLSSIGQTQWSSAKKIDFKTINQITLPYNVINAYYSIGLRNPIYACICPNCTNFSYIFGDSLDGILYIGGSTYTYANGADYTMSTYETNGNNGKDYANLNKMLYLPNATELLAPNNPDSVFGNKMWRKGTPWEIVYFKGIEGQKTTIADNVFGNCIISNLVINNTTLCDIKNSLLSALNVYVPDSILTETNNGGTTVYSLTIEDPWAAAGYSPTFKPISSFPTVATLEQWMNEGRPTKLVAEYM